MENMESLLGVNSQTRDLSEFRSVNDKLGGKGFLKKENNLEEGGISESV